MLVEKATYYMVMEEHALVSRNYIYIYIYIYTVQGYLEAGPGFGYTSPAIWRGKSWVWSGRCRSGFGSR